MRDLLNDLELGIRALAASPGLSAAAVVVLAIGVGANAAIFSLVDAVLLRPPPVHDPDGLVRLQSTTVDEENPRGAPRLSYLELQDFEAEPSFFDGVAGYDSGPLSLTGGEGPAERVWGATVTGNYFEVLGVGLSTGPGFSGAELDPATSRQVVVLSHELWARRFGGGEEVTGQSIEINGKRYTVVGVAPEGFGGIELELESWLGMATPPELWRPFSRSVELPFGLDIDDRGARILRVVARLRDGTSFSAARAFIETRSSQLEQAYPETNAEWNIEGARLVESRMSFSNRQSVSSFLFILVTVVALVLLIACLNLTGLLFVRANGRRKEIAVRMALGSSRWRIIRQLMVESALISGLGFLVSVPVAAWSVELLSTVYLPFEVPLHVDVRVDARMLSFAAAVAFAASSCFGLVAALRASRASAGEALRTRPPASSFPRRRTWGSLLIGVQVGLSLALMATATLFGRALMEAQAIEPGFDPSNVMTMAVDLRTESFRYDEPKGMQFYRDALSRVRAVPGVKDVSWAADLPLARSRLLIWFATAEEPPAEDAEYVMSDCDIVGPDYFRALGIPLVRGRDFTARDDGDVPVAIVNETMARRYWPGQDVLGKRFSVKGRAGVRVVEIVGVARDLQWQTLWDEPQPFLYLPLFQRYFPIMNLLVKVDGPAEALLDPVRSELARLDPKLPIHGIKMVDEQVNIALGPSRMGAALLGLSSLLATILAAVGVYGVTAYAVSQRTHELGIRSALGARRTDLVRLVVKHGLASAVVGGVLGAAGSLGIAGYVASALPGARPLGMFQIALSVFVLSVVVLAASYFPAVAAGKIDPVAALRSE